MKNESAKTTGAEELSFRRVMRGFDPEEVAAYLDDMSRAMREASKNYENRMADMKQELTLVNRECVSLRAKCYELERAAAAAAADTNEELIRREENHLKLIEGLQKQLEEARAFSGAAEGEQRIAELTGQADGYAKKLADAEKRAAELERQNRELADIRQRYENALAEKEALKAAGEALRDENRQLKKEMELSAEKLSKTEAAGAELKTELGRREVETALLQEKNEKYRQEISALKTAAKEKAYASAEKLSAEEEAFNREKLILQKKLQMQNYHIELAQTAVEEIRKQLEQITLSFGE